MAEFKIDPDEEAVLKVSETIKTEDEDGETYFDLVSVIKENCFMDTGDDDNSFHNSSKDPLEIEQNDCLSNASVENSDSGTLDDDEEWIPVTPSRNETPAADCTATGKEEGLSYYKIIVEMLPHKCDDCSRLFYDYIRFRDHRKEVHCSDPLVYCDVCDMPCGSKQVYEIHRATHTKKFQLSVKDQLEGESTLHKCKFCNFKVKGVRTFKYHMLTKHPKALEEECENKFKIHHIKYKYYRHKCELCFSRFSTEDGLIAHQATIHGLKRVYKCGICQEAFSTSLRKRKHRYECHPLPTYKKPDISPRKEKTFKCPASDCKSRYATNSELDSHKLKCIYCVTPKDTKCELCGKIFKYGRRLNLKTHKCQPEGASSEKQLKLRTKKDRILDLKFKCPEEGCDISCVSDFQLENHRNKMHGFMIPITNPTHQCRICGARFKVGKRRCEAMRHMNSVHPELRNTKKKKEMLRTNEVEEKEEFENEAEVDNAEEDGLTNMRIHKAIHDPNRILKKPPKHTY